MEHEIFTGTERFYINGEPYIFVSDKIDDGCEITLKNLETGQVFLVGEGNDWDEAMKEISTNIYDKGILLKVDNHIIYWQDLNKKLQKKIMAKLKTAKSDVISEWGTSDEHYNNWKYICNNLTVSINDKEEYIKDIFPRLITKSVYDNLYH